VTEAVHPPIYVTEPGALPGATELARAPAGLFPRFKAYLKRHPILFLALLTPGIPEYLSGSSPLANLVFNPFWLLLGFAFNLGMYLPGVLLVREARIRWNKGWATVLTLGAAYAIVEEGIGLSTMFFPGSNPFGAEGLYGYAFGVSWVWVPEVMLIHMVYSIGVPLLLFAYAFPELNGRSLLTVGQIRWVIAVFAVDIALLVVVVSRLLGFWMGDAVLAGALVSVAGLVGLAYALPKDLIRASRRPSRLGTGSFAALGATFLPGFILLGSLLEWVHLPTVVVALAIPAYGALVLGLVVRELGSRDRDLQLLALAGGTMVPIAIIGVAVQLAFPIVLVADTLALLFLLHLRNRLSSARPSLPPMAASTRA
jgi:hypothetical protein